MSEQIEATLTRPDLGSLAYVTIGDKRWTFPCTAQAHELMRKHGEVTYVRRSHGNDGSTEHYLIETGQ